MSEQYERFIESFNGRVVVFISGEDCKNVAVLSSGLRIGAAAPAQKRACPLAVFSGKLRSMEAEIDYRLQSNSSSVTKTLDTSNALGVKDIYAPKRKQGEREH